MVIKSFRPKKTAFLFPRIVGSLVATVVLSIGLGIAALATSMLLLIGLPLTILLGFFFYNLD